MTKRNDHHLTMYRRHAPKCPLKGKPRILDGCRCPLYYHGKLHGEFIRRGLDTRSHVEGAMEVQRILDGRPNPTDPNGGIALVAPPKGADVPFAFAVKDFLKFKSEEDSNGQVSGGTIRTYTRALKHFGQWVQARSLTMMRQIDNEQVTKYMKDFRRGRETSTARNRLTQLKVFFGYCAVPKRGWIVVPPTNDPELKGKKENGEGERVPFTPQQITLILAAVERMPDEVRDRARALVLLLLYTGMRISDATFFERACLVEHATRTVADYWVIKNRKRIKIPPKVQREALDALAKLPASETYFFQPDRADKYDAARTALRRGRYFQPLMPDYDAKVRETTNLVERVLALAGVEGSCHNFRHSFAVNMLTLGADVYTVSKMLGHSDVKITEKYLNLVADYRMRFSDATDNLAYVFPVAPASSEEVAA